MTVTALLLLATLALAGIPVVKADLVEVEADTVDELIGEINVANVRSGPTTIVLTAEEYVLTEPVPDDGSSTIGSIGLPMVVSNITIEGNGATIRRDANTTKEFRIFTVGSPGELHLDSVTVSNGRASWIDPGVFPHEFSDWGGGIFSWGTLTLTNSHVTSNTADGNGGGIYAGGIVSLTNSTVTGNGAPLGGGIANFGALTLTNSKVMGNTSTGDGVGIYNGGGGTMIVSQSRIAGNIGAGGSRGGGIYHSSIGTVTLTDSTISGNEATDGGGIFVASGRPQGVSGQLTLTDSVVSDNVAHHAGGGIANVGTLKLITSTVHGNTVLGGGDGGGIFNGFGSDLEAINSTISGNTADGRGGGVAISGHPEHGTSTVMLVNVTVTDNHAAAGIVVDEFSVLTLRSTIVAGNTAQDVDGTVAESSTYNLVGDGIGTNLNDGVNNNIVGVDPAIVIDSAGLQDNGGPTQTIALINDPSNPALNAISMRDCPVAHDQRGIKRPQGDGCDIGAFELEVDDDPLPVDYQVCLDFDNDTVKKLGSTVPIRLMLCDEEGNNLSSADITLSATRLVKVSNDSSGVVDAVASGNANPDGDFRFADDRYVFNLSTKGLSEGTWRLEFTADGQTDEHYRIEFKLRR
jgi:predicted outer membrane repeat protein